MSPCNITLVALALAGGTRLQSVIPSGRKSPKESARFGRVSHGSEKGARRQRIETERYARRISREDLQ